MSDLEHRLLERRRLLTEELERLTTPPPPGSTVSFGKRIGDGTAEAVERLATTATARSIAHSIEEIDRVLAKIEESTYGTCDGCGGPISEARLNARPATARCVSCA
jgi:DnaK suppressor protein